MKAFLLCRIIFKDLSKQRQRANWRIEKVSADLKAEK